MVTTSFSFLLGVSGLLGLLAVVVGKGLLGEYIPQGLWVAFLYLVGLLACEVRQGLPHLVGILLLVHHLVVFVVVFSLLFLPPKLE
jgi:hypothetical protein